MDLPKIGIISSKIKKGIRKVPSILNDALKAIFSFLRENPRRFIPLFIVALAFILRIYYLNELPNGLAKQEYLIVKRVLSIKTWSDLWLGIYFPQGIFIFLGALFSKVFGAKVIVFRLLTATLGTLTVLFAYLFTKEWFTKEAGYFASFLLAVSSWHITLSRNIDPNILLPLFLLLLFYVTTFAFRTKKNFYFILSGFILGLGLYVNIAFVLSPFLFVPVGLYFYFKNKKFVTSYIRELTFAIDAAAITSVPYLVSFVRYHSDFLKPYTIKMFSYWFYNIGSIIQSLFSHGETNYFYNLGFEPLVSPFVGIVLICAITFGLLNIRNRKQVFLLGWFLVFLLPGIFSKTTVIDKISGIIPVVFILAAVLITHLTRKWYTTFPFNKTARFTFTIILGLMFFLNFAYEYQKYFVARANSLQVKSVYSLSNNLPLK
ncbi:MAG: glycosyltransferase family 39 protein [Patescibacteria group bacterium]|nr:glycosyltransferase family 39 protein [Patescibacteria group bacterium]